MGLFAKIPILRGEPSESFENRRQFNKLRDLLGKLNIKSAIPKKILFTSPRPGPKK